MGILGIGAGASGGLDNYLHQLLQEQQQAEAERRNRATEALATRGQDLSEAQHRLATQQRGDVLAETERQHTAGRAALRGIGDVVQPGEATQEIGAGVPSSAYSKIPGLRSASTIGFQTAPDVTSKLTGFGGTPQSGQASTAAEQGPSTLQWAGTGAQREKVTADQLAQQKQDLAVQKQTDAEGQSRKDWERAQTETERRNRELGAHEREMAQIARDKPTGRQMPFTEADMLSNMGAAEVTGVKVLRHLKESGLEQSNDPLDPRFQKFVAQTLKIRPLDEGKADAIQRTQYAKAVLARSIMGGRPSQYVMQLIEQHLPDAAMSGKQLAGVMRDVLEEVGLKRTNMQSYYPDQQMAPVGGETYADFLKSSGAQGGGGVPAVGGTFQGGKVLKVTPIK